MDLKVKLFFDDIKIEDFENERFNVRVLMLKGEKGDPGVPTDEQVHEAVDDWLTDHPEATTTVQDDSLTTAKYKDSSVTTPKLADNSVTDAKLSSSGILLSFSKLIQSIADEFEDDVQYQKGKFIVYNGMLYKFTANHYGAWTGEDAALVVLSDEVAGGYVFVDDGNGNITIAEED